jgi:ATP citrate (pro-S)-lyase
LDLFTSEGITVDKFKIKFRSGALTKPVVAWVSGTCATLFKSEVQFGHAGARSGGETESAQGKNAALKAVGAVVPNSFEELEETIK